MLASAMAAVTTRIRLVVGAVVLPLHDPVMLAEKIALLDLLSNGRADVVLGAGYVPSEFAMFAASLKDRGALLDSGIDTILRALRGEGFEKGGRRIFVRPLPTRRPEDIVMVGGGVRASARRAARFDIGFMPMDPELVDVYLAECARRGQRPRQFARRTPGMPLAVHLCENPDIGWELIEPHAVHVVAEYARMAASSADSSAAQTPFSGLTEPENLRQAGLFAAWTPEQLLQKISTLPDGSSLGVHPLLGGLSPEHGWESLKLMGETLPRIAAAAAAE